MTNLEAIKSACNYPIDDIKLEKLLIDQDINPSTYYNGLTKAFELATASLYVLIVTSANIKDGDYSVNSIGSGDKSSLIKMASAIYTKYGIQDPFTPVEVKVNPQIRNRSNYW